MDRLAGVRVGRRVSARMVVFQKVSDYFLKINCGMRNSANVFFFLLERKDWAETGSTWSNFKVESD